MTGRLVSAALAVVVAGAGITAFVYSRSATPDTAVEAEDYNCTTCDARQKSKKRLSDHLQSQSLTAE